MAIYLGLALGAAAFVVVPVAIGIGMTMATPTRGELRFARILFIIAAILAVASFAWLTHEVPLATGKVIAAGLIGAAISISLVLGIDWINRRERAAFPKTNTSDHIVKSEDKEDKPQEILGPKSAPAPNIDLTKNEDVLIPANLPMPEHLPPDVPPNALVVFWGSNISWNTRLPHTVLEMADDPMIVIDKKPGTDNLVVTVLRVFDDRDDIIARIDEDGFWVKNTTRKKRPDPSTLVVYDHSDTEVLRIQFLNSRAISIEGIFRHSKLNPRYFIITKDRAVQMPNNNSISRSKFAEMGADIILTPNGFALGRSGPRPH
jgi:hypothetical protein